MLLNKSNYDFISKDNTVWLHGVLAILVLVSHLPNYMGLFLGSALGSVLQSFGSWCVALFFFLSGYGLYTSYKYTGGWYIDSLPKRRILPLYAKSLILVVCYVCVDLCLGHEFDFLLLFKSLTFFGTYIANGWYLQVLIIFYLLFYFIFRMDISDKKKISFLIVVTTIYYLVFYIYGLLYKNSYYGIDSIFCFVLGTIYAYKKNEIDRQLDKNKRATILTGFLIFAIGGVILILRKRIPIPPMLSGIQSTCITMCFAVGVLLLLRTFNINCKGTKFLGKYSFEIYVLQGIGFIFASSTFFDGLNLYIRVGISIVITVALCHPFHLIFHGVDKTIKER